MKRTLAEKRFFIPVKNDYLKSDNRKGGYYM